MELTDRIDADIQCLGSYFHRLFTVLDEAILESPPTLLKAQDVNSGKLQTTHHSFAHFIKPDMLINIYNLVDFWLKEICRSHKLKNKLNLEYRDIKGKNDLHTYKKYLTKYAGLDLSVAETSYKCLDELRKIRNVFIHSGGHIDENMEKELLNLDGIAIHGSLIVIEKKYIWKTLEHAKNFLITAANAYPNSKTAQEHSKEDTDP